MNTIMKFRNHIQLIASIILWVSTLCYTSSLMAALTVDRTRLIINGDEKAVSLTVRNQNNYAPYLVQSWLEDINGKKVSQPLVALPPIQRIEAGSKTSVRVQNLNKHNGLPSDRETLFYLNILEIPQKNEKKNTLQLALQTRLKVFYRPENLSIEPNTMIAPGLNKLLLTKDNDIYRIINTTPYYITVVSAKIHMSDKNLKGLDPFVIPPLKTFTVKKGIMKFDDEVIFSVINDYGAIINIFFNCAKNICSVNRMARVDI